MNKKVGILILAGLAALLAVLLVVCVWTEAGKIPDTLLIFPQRPINAGVDLQSMEEKNGEDILFTYEGNRTAVVNVLNRGHEVILKETNYAYPHVMGTTVTAGSFFTKEAQRGHQKLAVLNEKSAFELYGTLEAVNGELQIGGETYTVIGVVNDRDKKNLNIYVPFDVSAGRVDSFAVLIDRGDSTPEATVESKLKQYNVSRDEFCFYNLNQFAGGIWTKLFLSIALLFVVLLVVLMAKWQTHISRICLELKGQSDQFDFRELLQVCRRSVRQLVSYLFACVVAAVILLVSIGKAVGWILELQEHPSRIVADYSASFAGAVNVFNRLAWYSQIAFAGFLLLWVLFVLLLPAICRRSGKSSENQQK